MRGYMIEQFEVVCLNVTTDEFHATTPIGDRKNGQCYCRASRRIERRDHYFPVTTTRKYFKDLKVCGRE